MAVCAKQRWAGGLRTARPGRSWAGLDGAPSLTWRSTWAFAAAPGVAGSRVRGRPGARRGAEGPCPTPGAALAVRPPANVTRVPQQHCFKTASLTVTWNPEVPQLKYEARM